MGKERFEEGVFAEGCLEDMKKVIYDHYGKEKLNYFNDVENLKSYNHYYKYKKYRKIAIFTHLGANQHTYLNCIVRNCYVCEIKSVYAIRQWKQVNGVESNEKDYVFNVDSEKSFSEPLKMIGLEVMDEYNKVIGRFMSETYRVSDGVEDLAACYSFIEITLMDDIKMWLRDKIKAFKNKFKKKKDLNSRDYLLKGGKGLQYPSSITIPIFKAGEKLSRTKDFPFQSHLTIRREDIENSLEEYIESMKESGKTKVMEERRGQ